jgi:HPt (histidine-containing phosphotransfer) domain-containing protein
MNTKKLHLLDTVSAIANMGDDPELYGQIAEIFFEDSVEQLATLAGALVARDFPTARLAAHSLKGTAATLGAERLQESCSLLEKACVDADSTAITVADSAMRAELADTTAALRAFLAQA